MIRKLVASMIVTGALWAPVSLFAASLTPASSSGIGIFSLDTVNFPQRGQIARLRGPGMAVFRYPESKIPNVLFVSFSLQPDAEPNWETGTILSVGGISLAYERSAGSGGMEHAQLAVVDLSAGQSAKQLIQATMAVNPTSHLCGFQNIVLRLDFRTSTCDLFVAGHPMKLDLSLAAGASRESLVIFPGVSGSALLSDLSMSESNPLFEDKNANGIPDDFEASWHDNSASASSIRSHALLRHRIQQQLQLFGDRRHTLCCSGKNIFNVVQFGLSVGDDQWDNEHLVVYLAELRGSL